MTIGWEDLLQTAPDSDNSDYTPVDMESDSVTGIPDTHRDGNGVPVFYGQNGKVSTAMGGCGWPKRKSTLAMNSMLVRIVVEAVFGLFKYRVKKLVLSGTAILTLTVAFTSPLIVSDVSAQESEFNRRFYAGANVGMSQLDPDASGIDATVDEKNDLGFGLYLGMDISNRLSAELHGNVLGTAKLAPNGEIDYQVYGLSALIYGLNASESRQLREGYSAYLRLGLDTMSNSADVPYELENDFSYVLGLGAEYGLHNGLAVRGELTRFYSDAYFAGLGVLYRFGGPRHQAMPGAALEGETRTQSQSMPIAEEPEPTSLQVQPELTPVDQDGDGVLDDVDQCLGSSLDVPLNAIGCALFDGVMEGVTFEPASAALTIEAKLILDRAATELLNYPAIRVAVMAHTDSQGSANHNLELAKKRVISVVRYLLAQGVPLNRMRAEAYGEKRPLASNDTVEGRLRNRRIEFRTIE